MKINKNNKIALAFAAAAAIVSVMGVSLYQQSLASNLVLIDFNAYPVNDNIILRRGQSLQTPVMIESPKNAEMTISLSVSPDNLGNSTTVIDSITGKLVPRGLSISLDKQSITLSNGDQVRDIGSGRVVRNAGTLSLAASPDAELGTYTYVLEAKRNVSGGQSLVAGKIVTITIQ